MTVTSTLNHWKTAWEKWNIRGIVVLSLSLQAILILFAPLRKRSANTVLIFSVWSAYLLADWAAAFAVGHISDRQKYDKLANDDKHTVDPNSYLIAFWAPFLLVHLGGPDTITAFALEDNALWLRHLLNLIFQVSAALYVFYQTMPGNVLWLQTVLMMIAGLIKYVERTRALYLANLKRFKKSMLEAPDPGPNYAKLMDEYSSLKDASLPATIKIIPEPNRESKMTDDEIKEGDLDEIDVVKYGYSFFETFKGLIVDIIFTFHERRKSREFFQKRTASDALKVISVELNFIYEVLYTKVLVVHSTLGYIFRLIASGIIITTLVMFTHMKKHHQYHLFERMVTYALLYGAIGLDVIALLMLLFSDWSVAYAIRKTSNQKKTPFISAFLANYVSIVTRWNEPDFTHCHIERTVQSKESLIDRIWKKFLNTLGISTYTGKDKYEVFDTTVLFRRWSESIYAYNLLSVCLKLRPQEMLKHKQKSYWRTVLVLIASILLVIPGAVVFCFGLIGWLILRCCNWLIKAVFPEVIDIGHIANAFSKAWDTFVLSAAEKLGLEEVLDSMKYVSRNPFLTKLWDFIYDELQVKSVFAEDTKIAKQIYEAKGEWVLKDGEWSGSMDEIMEYVKGEYDRILLLWHIATELCYNTEETPKTQNGENTEKYVKEFSKILSDYMLYLLIKQPTMMSNIAGIGQIRFRDTCAEAKKFFNRKGTAEKDTLKDACLKILEVDTSAKPLDVKGDRSKSVLFDGCRLAIELRKRNDKWIMMSRVWAELLSYAAGHCRAETHAQLLSKGGELITLVWLLMAHLGIGEQFQINEGHARAKLLLDP